MEKQYEKVYFTTATILEWKQLLRNDELKEILIDSFRFAVKENRARFWSFIIMENHIHLVWQILDPYDLEFVMRNLLKFTAHQFLNYFRDRDRMDKLQPYIVDAKDRYYQFWERNNLSIEL
jgi:putative transposase